MRPLNCLCGLLFVCSVATGQSNRDSLLAEERSIDRPVNLHAGQLRFTAGYGLSSITKSFDRDGSAVKLRDEGISYVRHGFPISVQYGISEYIEIGLSTAYKRQVQREKEVLSAAGQVLTNLFQVNERNGFEDLALLLRGRLPINVRKTDIVVNVGVQLPVGSGKTEKPQNSFFQQNLNATVLRNIVYNNKLKWGNGISVGRIGGTIKSRTPEYAFALEVDFFHAFGVGEGRLWHHQLVGTQFEYNSEAYRYLLPDRLTVFFEIERQLAPWFDLSLQLLNEKSSGGWVEDKRLKVKRDVPSSFTLSPGYELLVTPRTWLRQKVAFVLGGKSVEAPLSFTTTLAYNIFPF